jgi:hypothetical protein
MPNDDFAWLVIGVFLILENASQWISEDLSERLSPTWFISPNRKSALFLLPLIQKSRLG